MSNTYLYVAHSADNTMLYVATLGGAQHEPIPVVQDEELGVSLRGAKTMWERMGMDVEPLDLCRVYRMETKTTPYVVRVRGRK